MRYLVLILLAVLAVWLVRRAWRRASLKGDAPAASAGGELVACAHCGVHLPRAEARLAGDRVYCSDEHARLGPGRG